MSDVTDLPPPTMESHEHAQGFAEGYWWQRDLRWPSPWTGVYVRAFQLGPRCTGFVVHVEETDTHEYIEMNDYWHGYVTGVTVAYTEHLKPERNTDTDRYADG